MSTWNPEVEAAFAFRAAELLQPAFEHVKHQLPPGTDFGILVVVPPELGGSEGRAIALTTDRRRVAVSAAQWVLSVLEPADLEPAKAPR